MKRQQPAGDADVNSTFSADDGTDQDSLERQDRYHSFV